MSVLKKESFRENIVEIALYIFVATLPFELIFTPIAFGLLLASFLFFGNRKNLSQKLKYQKLALLPISLYVLNFLHLLFLTEGGFDYSKIDTQLLLLLIPITIVLVSPSLKQITKVKQIFVYAMVAFCVISLISLGYNLIVNFEHKGDYNFIQTSMYHFHYPYDALHINTAYAILIFSDKIKYLNKQLATILFFIFLILSGVRLGVFCFVLISVFYFVKNIKQLMSYKLLLGVAATLIIGFVLIKNSRYVNDKFFDTLSKLGFNTEQYVSEIGEEYHKLTLREKLWSSANEAYDKSPSKLLGYGPNGSRQVLNNIYLNNSYNIEKGMNSHNQYLTTLLNGGILGLVVLLSIIVLALYKSYKSRSTVNTIIVNLILVVFITESMLERQKGIVFFALFLTLIFIEGKLRLESKETQ